MAYSRVIPRDLFNESKLLKCLGGLALLLHDHEGRGPLSLEHEDPETGFVIEQDEASGDLYCTNLTLYLHGEQAIAIWLNYNSKQPYPLYCDGAGNYYAILDDSGEFSPGFLDYVAATKPTSTD